MNSRERIFKTINHEEPDRIPLDLAGSVWTGITNTAYQNLRKHLGMKETQPEWSDVIQQIVIPSEDILNDLEVDTRGLFPLTSHNWDVYSKLKDCGDYLEYMDEWSFVHHFPKNGYWFSLVKSPLIDVDFEQEVIDDVKKNIEALAPGGGFVFNTAHNIQAEVPPENMMAMWQTLRSYNKL